MSQEIRRQRKCYFASAEYAASFWGKYIWLFQGKATLRLTDEALILEGGSRDLAIPLDAIKGIGLGRFSSAAKPFGLERLVVRYSLDGELETIDLIPFESAFDPTWATSQVVESWFETFGRLEALAGRVEPPAFEPVAAPSYLRAGAFAAVGSLAVVVPAIVTWLFLHR